MPKVLFLTSSFAFSSFFLLLLVGGYVVWCKEVFPHDAHMHISKVPLRVSILGPNYY